MQVLGLFLLVLVSVYAFLYPFSSGNLSIFDYPIDRGCLYFEENILSFSKLRSFLFNADVKEHSYLDAPRKLHPW